MADVDISLEIQAKKAKKELDKINKELKDTGKNAKKAGKELDKSFKVSAGVIAGATASIAALGAGLSFAIGEAIKFEDITTQFIAFTGSAEAAAKQVEKIAEFSARTPFRLEELADANRTLLAFGSSTEESLIQLEQLGEAAAATGKDIGELATIFGQIQAEGKLTGERFNQLVERGINIGPALAEGLGVAESSLRDLRAQGAITADDVAKAFEKMTTEGGIFFGSTERLSKTLSGSTSTLEDNISQLAATVGSKLTPALVVVTNATSDLIKEFNEALKPKDTTITGEILALKKQIALTELNASDLQKSLDKLALKDDKLSAKKFEEVNAELEKTDLKTQELIKQFQRLSQAQQGATQRESQAEDREKELKAEEEKKLKLKAIEDAAIADTKKKREELVNAIQQLEAQEIANREARAATENELLISQLDTQLETIKDKEVEKQAALLELDQQFQAAQELQAKASADKIKKANDKARNDEFNLQKTTDQARIKWDEQTWQQRAKTAQTGLSALASIQSLGSREAFEIGKAASIAQALITIPETAIKAYSSLAGIPIVGPGLGAAAAAAAIAAGTARINQIRATKFQGFAEGGLVQGGIPGIDSVPAMLTPGEVVIPEKNFKDLRFNNEAQVFETRAVRENIEETNGILRQIASQRALNEQQERERFREEKFSSTTPGGIFYEPVDDSFDPEIEVVQKTRVGVAVSKDRPFKQQQIARR